MKLSVFAIALIIILKEQSFIPAEKNNRILFAYG